MVVVNASVGVNQPLYGAFLLQWHIDNPLLQWSGPVRRNPSLCLSECYASRTEIFTVENRSTKQSCSPLEDNFFCFLEGAAVNHEWQWYVIITSRCQILETPLLFLSIYHWHCIIKTTNVGESHPVQNMKQMRGAACVVGDRGGEK